MKKITKQFLFCALSLSALTFVSCENDDDATGDSTLEVTDGVTASVSLTAPLAAMQTVNEFDEGTYEYTITLSAPQSKDIHVTVKQIAGSADGDDFEFDADILIPAYTTTATGSISILNDVTVEGVEDFTLQIGTVSTSNASLAPTTVKFTINNYLSNELDLTLNFNKSFTVSGTALTLCGIGYDMDFYLLDATFADTGNYDAATGACPEHLVLDASTLADGEYHIFYDIYDDGNLSTNYHDPFDIPVTVDYLRAGGIAAGTFAQEADYAPNTTDGSGSDYVVTIEVAAGVFTIKNSIPEVIATGRGVNKAKAAIANARLNKRR